MNATRYSQRLRRNRPEARGGACVAAASALTAGAILAGLAALPATTGLVASPLASSKPEAAQPATSWREIQRAAKAAHDAGDFQAYRADVQRLFQVLSGHPDTVFAMAKAEARLGHAAAALDWLGDFAAMGLVRDAAAEPDLASLRQLPGFAAVLARIEANRRPVARSVRAFTLPDRAMLSEDIAYDPGARRFLVSSIHDAKIVAIDGGSGTTTDFVPAGRDAIWGVLALVVDAPRGVLWATTAAMPQTRGYRAADAGHTAVLRYDLATGKLQKRYDLPVPARPAAGKPESAEERDRVLGDMTVGAGGDVFVSEAVTGAVYVIRRGRDALEVLVAPGTFISPQTPAATPDGRRLFVADYARGIGIVDLATRTVSWMAHPRGVAVGGMDGLYLVGDSLVAVQNGTEPNRVIRLYLDPPLTRVLRWEALESNSPGLGAPTHGTLVGKDFFFIGNSGWDQLADDGSLKPGAVQTPPVVLRVTL